MDIVFAIKNTCKTSALVSFAIGTIILILFMITREIDPFAYIGIWYLYVAFAINAMLFFLVILSALFLWKNSIELLGHAMLLTLNIPVAIGYFFIVLNFIDT